ncbi:MAG: TonB-dependent receptor [Candidatus Marinimicrobia bacterium]|nr:TonB-dependent receptor [Candidatus Neomarinimicrobiota bacterium]
MRAKIYKSIIQRSFVLAIMCSTAFAGVSGKIAGMIKDAYSGEPLIGCNVVLEGTYFGGATDIDGSFVILNIPPGEYTIKANMIGYASGRMEGIIVAIDLTTEIKLELNSELLEGEEVIVTFERPKVQRDRTSSQVHVDGAMINDLPVEEVSEVLELQSGVTKDAGGGIHIRGGRSRELVYWIDGVPVSDGYDGSQIVEVDKNAIQELQMVSGTFNAEYGQAMSGIINMVTKTGGDKFSANLDMSMGGWLATTDDIFLGLDTYDPTSNLNLSASFGGPISKKLRFYISGRKYSSTGHLKGLQIVEPQPLTTIDSTTRTELYDINFSDTTMSIFDFILTERDSSSNAPIVDMNTQDKYSINGKLSYMLTPSINLHANYLISNREYRDYDHFYRWNPKGILNRFDEGRSVSLTLNHSLSPQTYYALKLAQSNSHYQHYLYEDPLDPRYANPEVLSMPAYTFALAGTNMSHFERNSQMELVKFDFTSQFHSSHLLQFGAEYRRHQLDREDYSIVAKVDSNNIQLVPFQPDTLSTSTPNHSYYNEKPEEVSFYIQDKLEYDDFVVNIGIRWDWFHSHGVLPADSQDPAIYNPLDPTHADMTLEEREAIWYKEVGAKSSISPRLGLAFPITDKGVIHFSYGHFFQIPSFEYLYTDRGFKVNTTDGTYGPFGNPDLNPKRTVKYELGLQQQLTNSLNIDLTMFYQDIRDWVSTGIIQTTYLPGVNYVSYTNKDYANSRGVTLTLDQGIGSNGSLNIQYTYQIAEGSNSNPDAEFLASQSNSEPTKEMTPLDWDQRHTANGALTFQVFGARLTLLARFGSGYPYTPSYGVSSRTGLTANTGLASNSRLKPSTFDMDFKASRKVSIAGMDFGVSLNVNNLLDTRNATSVHSDTGSPTYSGRLQSIIDNRYGLNTVGEYIQYPTWYYAPREILLGVNYSF